jgi:hypothetical protein
MAQQRFITWRSRDPQWNGDYVALARWEGFYGTERGSMVALGITPPSLTEGIPRVPRRNFQKIHFTSFTATPPPRTFLIVDVPTTNFHQLVRGLTNRPPHISVTVNAATAYARATKPRGLTARLPHISGTINANSTLVQQLVRALTPTLPQITENIRNLQSTIQMDENWLSYVVSVPIVLPSPPPTPVPGVIPVASGLIVRALSGKVIDMATPSITDGTPT